MIKSERELWAYVDQLVEEIKTEYDLNQFDVEDVIHQTVEGCEHVIDSNKAHSIYHSCDISKGESLIEEMTVEPSNYDDYDSWVVYAELRLRVLERFNIYY